MCKMKNSISILTFKIIRIKHLYYKYKSIIILILLFYSRWNFYKYPKCTNELLKKNKIYNTYVQELAKLYVFAIIYQTISIIKKMNI